MSDLKQGPSHIPAHFWHRLRSPCPAYFIRSCLLIGLLLFNGGFTQAEEAARASIDYLSIAPPIIVNLQERRHYLRAAVDLMIQGEDNRERIERHMPAIRHTLIMLLSGQPFAKMIQAEEREHIRKAALKEIQGTLDHYADSQGLEDVFFTDYLVQ